MSVGLCFSAFTTKAMAKLFRNKVFSVALPRRAARLPIPSKPRKDPLLIKEMARGCRDGKILLFFAQSLQRHADHGGLRQNATTCDVAMIYDKSRPITAFRGNASVRRPHQ